LSFSYNNNDSGLYINPYIMEPRKRNVSTILLSIGKDSTMFAIIPLSIGNRIYIYMFRKLGGEDKEKKRGVKEKGRSISSLFILIAYLP
jgi:hypothetical protein